MNKKNKSSLARITAEELFDAAGIKTDNIDIADLNRSLFEIHKTFGNKKYPDSVIRTQTIIIGKDSPIRAYPSL